MIKNKKILMVLAFRGFRDEEYFIPKEILEKAGYDVKVASNKTGVAVGADGGEAGVDFLVPEVSPEDFEAVVFVGGLGCLKNLDNEDSYKLIRETVKNDKILGAICISPVILAKAGVLNGKDTTVWSDAMDKSAIKILEKNGAIYQKIPVAADGKTVTACGPEAAEDFAEKISEILKEIDKI
jgi:protease I